MEMNELTQKFHCRSGWTAEETNTLFAEAHAADLEGRPIKSVFDKVAHMTGRKPNSIRNYYYLKLKEEGSAARTSFVPFLEEEVRSLVRAMLTEQAKGKSVRSIAMEMGEGDKKKMLRFQNKYRSVIRLNPEYVRAVMQELEQEGVAYADPFISRRKARGRDVSVVVSELVENLSQADIDAEAFLDSLLALASAAAQRTSKDRASEFIAELGMAKRENAELREKYAMLCAVNRGFLQKSGMERIAGLSDYVLAVGEIIGSGA